MSVLVPCGLCGETMPCGASVWDGHDSYECHEGHKVKCNFLIPGSEFHWGSIECRMNACRFLPEYVPTTADCLQLRRLTCLKTMSLHRWPEESR